MERRGARREGKITLDLFPCHFCLADLLQCTHLAPKSEADWQKVTKEVFENGKAVIDRAKDGGRVRD